MRRARAQDLRRHDTILLSTLWLCVGGVIISVHTCRDESLTKNLSRSAPRLTGRPRVEALVACGAHQIQTQGKCTREVGGRESGRGRESERACVPVPLSCGGRACTILLQEGGGAQSCSQRRHVNEYGPIAAHTGCTIAGLPYIFLYILPYTMLCTGLLGIEAQHRQSTDTAGHTARPSSRTSATESEIAIEEENAILVDLLCSRRLALPS